MVNAYLSKYAKGYIANTYVYFFFFCWYEAFWGLGGGVVHIDMQLCGDDYFALYFIIFGILFFSLLRFSMSLGVLHCFLSSVQVVLVMLWII